MKRITAAVVVSLLSLLVPAGSPAISNSSQSERQGLEAQDEIVVIARKLRKVRLRYELFGPHLKQCDVLVSSGQPRLDRIACAILNLCIKQGHREVPGALACVRGRIDALDTTGADIANMDGAEPPARRIADTSEPNPAAEQPEELVVRGKLPQTMAGEWLFYQQEWITSSSRGGRALPPKSWRMCVSTERELEALRLMVREHDVSDVPSHCRDWSVQIEGARVLGEQRCMLQDTQVTATLSGSFSKQHVSISKQSLARGISRSFEVHRRSDLSATRTGECKTRK